MRHCSDSATNTVWCLGMYASGSTWLYNAARQVAATVQPGLEKRACYAETLKMLAPVQAGGGIRIVKTHQLPGAAAAFLNREADAILLSIRDPRDAVLSLMQYMGHGFSDALSQVHRSAMFCERFAADPRTILFKYENGYTDDPATFGTLARVFGGDLAPPAQDGLFAGSRRPVIEARIAELGSLPGRIIDNRSGDHFDPDTHWHAHHARRTGESGRWRRALPEHAVLAIETRLGDWMRCFGYETGPLP